MCLSAGGLTVMGSYFTLDPRGFTRHHPIYENRVLCPVKSARPSRSLWRPDGGTAVDAGAETSRSGTHAGKPVAGAADRPR